MKYLFVDNDGSNKLVGLDKPDDRITILKVEKGHTLGPSLFDDYRPTKYQDYIKEYLIWREYIYIFYVEGYVAKQKVLVETRAIAAFIRFLSGF